MMLQQTHDQKEDDHTIIKDDPRLLLLDDYT